MLPAVGSSGRRCSALWPRVDPLVVLAWSLAWEVLQANQSLSLLYVAGLLSECGRPQCLLRDAVAACRVRARQQEKHSRDWVHRRSRSRSRDRHRDRDRDRHSKHSHHRREEPLTAEEKEAAAQKQRDKEQAELDDEVTKRRKRAEVWQAEQRRRAEQSGAAQPQIKEEEDETGQQAGWTLDDEGDEEDEADQLLPGQQEGTDEVVPEAEPAAELEAPADNKTAIKAEPADAEDEEDPLDAFMQGLQPAAQQQDTVMPDVKVERQAENGNAASRTAGRAPKRRGKTRYDTSSSSEDLGSDDQDSDDEVRCSTCIHVGPDPSSLYIQLVRSGQKHRS